MLGYGWVTVRLGLTLEIESGIRFYSNAINVRLVRTILRVEYARAVNRRLGPSVCMCRVLGLGYEEYCVVFVLGVALGMG